MKQNSQLTSQAHYSSFLSILPTPLGYLQAPTTQIAVLTEGTQDVVGTVHEESAKIAVASLGDMKLRIVLTGLILLRDKAKTGTDFTAFPETMRIFEGENISQGSERSNTADVSKQICFGIMILAELFDLTIISIDLLSKGGDMIQDRSKSRKQILRYELSYLFMEAGSGTGRKSSTCGFDHTAHVVDKHGTCAHKDISRADHGQVSLSLLTAVKDRGEKFGIEASQASQIFGVDLVIFTGILVDQTKLACIGHDDLMTQILQGLTCPTGVRSHFHGNAAGRDTLELSSESILGGGNAAFFDHFSILIQDNND
jgi:hypothetical protein